MTLSTASPLRPVALALSVLLALAGCATTRDYVAPSYRDNPVPDLPEGEVAFRVFLTGNTGDLPLSGGEAVLTAMGNDARAAGEASAVVLLGDETANGLSETPTEDEMSPVRALGLALRSYEGRVFVLPGDRDWAQGEDGVKRLEDALLETLGDSVLTPGDQAGGPRDIELAPGLRLFPIDTAWWLLAPEERPNGSFETENVRSTSDVATFLDRIVEDRGDDQIIVVGHHPLRSNGEHAGQRSFFDGLASLGIAPVAGQTLGLSNQDLASQRYRSMRDVLDRIFEGENGLVYVSSHDRSLQTFDIVRSPVNEQVYMVSGTGGGRAEAAAAGRGAAHVLARPGYQRLVYFTDGRLWAETVEVDPRTGGTVVAFRQEISAENPELVDPEIPETTAGDIPPEIGTQVTLAADANFRTGPFRNDGFTRFLWGSGYRDEWATPVTFDVLDMGTEGGGLVPTKRGGGMQTTSLRLLGGDGREYGLRLIEKGGTAQVPEELRNGVVASVVLDLRSAQIPYGALVAYPLSRAAGVLLAEPRLVYVPDDPRLGRFRSVFANQIALLEVRAADDMSGVEGFEGVTDVVSEPKLREKLREDQDHRVDQRAFLRARLLDMLIADWDRHEDQWRWVPYEPGDLDPTLTGDDATRGKVYRPIARDHDFAFYGVNGLGPALLRRYADERLQGFTENMGNLRALTTNGFTQDRRFFNELTREDFEAVAEDLRLALSDGVVDQSVRALPSPIYAQIGPEWTRILKVRRDQLSETADRLYDLHAGIVDVVGSDERERFTATRESDGRLSVVVRSNKTDSMDRVLYERTFLPSETREVRFYGLGGRDVFEVVGTGPDRISVRAIGGAAGDSLSAPAGDVAFYDTPDGGVIGERGRQVEDRRADDGGVNTYDTHERVLGRNRVFPVAGYNATDGVLVGAAWSMEVPGFRLEPLAATHTVAATVATFTGGIAGTYTGRMRQAVFDTDLDVDALASTPRYVRNFYGLGNGTAEIDGDLARIDIARAQLDAGFGGNLGQGLRLVAGPSIRYADVSRGDSLEFTPLDALADFDSDVLDPQLHAGAFARLTLSTAYGGVNPQQGFTLTGTGAYRAGVTSTANSYGQVGGEAQAYFPINFAPQLTLALRAGADHRFGDYPFFDAAVIGGPRSLRGFRRERFAGRTAAFGGAEVRTKLFKVDTYALPFSLGALAFVDAGRVWADVPYQECDAAGDCAVVDFDNDVFNSSDIHLGYGGGLFFNVLDTAVLTLAVGHSNEETLVTFGTGFSF